MIRAPATGEIHKVNDIGCHIVFRLEGVNFATNNADLTGEATAQLEKALQLLLE